MKRLRLCIFLLNLVIAGQIWSVVRPLYFYGKKLENPVLNRLKAQGFSSAFYGKKRLYGLPIAKSTIQDLVTANKALQAQKSPLFQTSPIALYRKIRTLEKQGKAADQSEIDAAFRQLNTSTDAQMRYNPNTQAYTGLYVEMRSKLENLRKDRMYEKAESLIPETGAVPEGNRYNAFLMSLIEGYLPNVNFVERVEDIDLHKNFYVPASMADTIRHIADTKGNRRELKQAIAHYKAQLADEYKNTEQVMDYDAFAPYGKRMALLDAIQDVVDEKPIATAQDYEVYQLTTTSARPHKPWWRFW